jgi:hypothetical protein
LEHWSRTTAARGRHRSTCWLQSVLYSFSILLAPTSILVLTLLTAHDDHYVSLSGRCSFEYFNGTRSIKYSLNSDKYDGRFVSVERDRGPISV